MTSKRDPREPTPLVLMNPELRVRQLRYAANIEATLMVPLHRYYEVLLDLSIMGLEYLKAMKLERAFIIFKRIEYFIFHRLRDHPGAQSFSSESKTKIMGRLPMIMYVAQQIIVDFIMPVYERQAAYFRYEELQRRLSIVNPTAWNAIMSEAARRESEFYSEAEKISSRFGVELSSFLPRSITPDDNHPSNFPPRTYPANVVPKSLETDEEVPVQTALSVAINCMNSTAESITISGDQPIQTLIRSINSMMNNALLNFFTAHQTHTSRFLSSGFPEENVSELSYNQLAEVNHLPSTVIPDMAQNDISDSRQSYSPRVDHMYRMPAELPGNFQCRLKIKEDKNPNEYNPKYTVDTYIKFLNVTYHSNSSTAAGYRVNQVAHEDKPSPSTAGYMLHLEPTTASIEPEVLISTYNDTILGDLFGPSTVIIPEPDPGPPRGLPPTAPSQEQEPEANNWGIWAKRGTAFGPNGMGSLGVLSDLDRAKEILDLVPPMPPGPDNSDRTVPSSFVSRSLKKEGHSTSFYLCENRETDISNPSCPESTNSASSRKRKMCSNE